MALANKKTPRKFFKDRTGGLFSSDRITQASASMASDETSNDINILEGPMAPILYKMDLLQEDLDEVRRYASEELGSGGGGLTNTPLAQVSGRFQWSSADDGERIHIGNSSYGPFNWYSFTGEPSYTDLRTYSAGTVDSTTSTVANFQPQSYGIYVPDESKKVKARVLFRCQNADGLDFGFSMWDCAPPTNGSTATHTITLRAQSGTTTADSSTTKMYTAEFTTTSAVSNKYLFFLAENRAGNLGSNTYIYANISFFLVD